MIYMFNISMTQVIVSFVIVFSIFIVLKSKRNKKSEAMYMTIFTAGIGLMSSASESFFDKVITFTAVVSHNNNAPELRGSTDYVQLILGFALIIISIVMRKRDNRKLYLLNINGQSHDKKVEYFAKDLKMDKFDFKEEEIDIVEIYMNLFNKNYDESVFKCILNIISKKIEAFKYATKNIKVGYTGATSIPLVMYAGSLLEGENFKEYYEFDKTKDISNSYYKLSKERQIAKFIPKWIEKIIDKDKAFNYNYQKLNIPDISSIDKSAKEIVLSVALTQRITDGQLAQFKTENIIKVEVDTIGDNTIRSINQLNEYSNVIINLIKQLQDEFTDLKVVHLVYCGQSCLAMKLGQRLADKTRMVEVRTYQFDNQSDIKYPWGIVVNGDESGKLIKFTKEM